jgi:outer membrane protein assembly factor BamB
MPPPGRSNTAQPSREASPKKTPPQKPSEKTTSSRSDEKTADQRRAPAREDSRRPAEPPPSTPVKAKREESSRREEGTREEQPQRQRGQADSGSLRSPLAEIRTTPGSSSPSTLVWTYPRLIPGQNLDLGAQRGCVAIDGNRQMLITLGKKLFALTEHEEGPRELWDYPTRGYIPGSATVGRDGNIRVHSGDGMLHCVSGIGEQAFPPVKVGEPLGWASPLVDDDNNTFVCAYNGGLIKIDSRGGKATQPFFRSRQKFDSTGVIHRGVLYVGAEDAFVYAIRLTASQGRNEWNHAKDHGKTEWFINTAIAYHDGLFIVAGRDEYLYGFNEEGLTIWKLHLRGQMLGSPVIDDRGNIYVGVSLDVRGDGSSGKLVCVSASSHDVRWEYQAAGAIESTPVIGDDDVLYFGDNEGVVHAVDLSGRAKWTQKVGAAVRSGGAITPAKRVIFGTDRGDIVALACSSSGLAKSGWPKFLGTAAQSGMTPRRT